MDYNQIIVGKKEKELVRFSKEFEVDGNLDFFLSEANWIAVNREVGIGKHICESIINDSPESLKEHLDELLNHLDTILSGKTQKKLSKTVRFIVHPPGIEYSGDKRIVKARELIKKYSTHRIIFYASKQADEVKCKKFIEIFNLIYKKLEKDREL
jgi:hypothetical protein